MKKTIFIIALITVGIFGLMYWGSTAQRASATPQNDSGAPSALTVSEKLYEFGTISMKNGNVSRDFVITNPTSRDIFIPSLVTSCMCTSAYFVEADGSTKGPFGMPGMGFVPPANETIKAGEQRTLRVVYNPNAHGPAGVGPIDRFAIVTDSTGAKLEVEIKAVVTP